MMPLVSASTTAQIQIVPLPLPSGDITGIILVGFERLDRDKGFFVSLPASSHFRAIRQGSSERERFFIWQLDGAEVDAEANVLLPDGTKIRAVEVERTRLPVRPSQLEWLIVHYTLGLIARKDCYRSLQDGVPSGLHGFVPDRRYLDCARLTGLTVNHSLKEIARYIAQRDSTLRNLSRQKIADALRTFGIRVPPPRKHAT